MHVCVVYTHTHTHPTHIKISKEFSHFNPGQELKSERGAIALALI